MLLASAQVSMPACHGCMCGAKACAPFCQCHHGLGRQGPNPECQVSNLRPPFPALGLYVQGHMTKAWQRHVAGFQTTASGKPEQWWYTSQAAGRPPFEALYD